MNLLFMGPPGSGKGTQSKLLKDKLGLVHLSTGDMFRKAISDQTAVGLKAKGFMDRGEYVPDAVVIDVIRERLAMVDCKNQGFILDGFPRTVPQAAALEDLLIELGTSLSAVLFFDVNKTVLVTRLSSRRTCRKCQYIISEDQLIAGFSRSCPSASGTQCDFYQRDDDRADVVQKRIEVYQTQTTPVLDFYRQKGSLRTIDGDQAPDVVFNLILNILKKS